MKSVLGENFLFREFYPKFAIFIVSLGAVFGLPTAAHAQYSNSVANGVEITVGNNVIDTDESNNFAADVDFARGSITVAKTGDGTANLAVSSALPSGYTTTGTGTVTVTSVASFDGDNSNATPDAPISITQTDTNASSDSSITAPATFNPGDSSTYNTLPTGAYTFTETPVANASGAVPKLVSLTCTTSLPASSSSFTAATTFNAGNGAVTGTAGGTTTFHVLATGANQLSAAANQVAINLAPGEQVNCTFNNQIVDLEVTKTWRQGACASSADTSAASDTENAIPNPTNTGNYTPGGQGCYVVTIANQGSSSTSSSFVFADSLFNGSVSSDLTINSASCSAAGSATCGAFNNGTLGSTLDIGMNGSDTTITAGDSISISVDVNVDSARTTDLVNTAGVFDLFDPNADTPNELSASLTLQAQITVDVSVNKTDNVLRYTPGASLTYTINVCNYGPSDVTGANMRDSMPSGITPTAPSCTATDISTLGAAAPTSTITGGATSNATAATFTCPASVSAGTTFDVPMNLPVGSCVTVSVPYTVDN